MPATGTSILSIGRATPALRLTQEQSLEYAGYSSDRIRRIFLNTGIAYRHFYLEKPPRPDETSDELNRRYLDGAMETGCRTVHACLEAAGLSPRDVDLLVVCSSTGYACPDIGTRLVEPVGLRPDVQRASMIGLGCAGALPALQRACDFTEAHPGRIAGAEVPDAWSYMFPWRSNHARSHLRSQHHASHGHQVGAAAPARAGSARAGLSESPLKPPVGTA